MSLHGLLLECGLRAVNWACGDCAFLTARVADLTAHCLVFQHSLSAIK